MQNREMVTMEKILLFSLAVLGQLTVSFAEDRLLNLAKLKMFVDELPDMPKIQGYDMVSGVPKSKSLKIGMFKKKWVSFFLSLFSFGHFGKLVFFSCSLGFRQYLKFILPLYSNFWLIDWFYQLTLMFKTVFHVLDFDWFLEIYVVPSDSFLLFDWIMWSIRSRNRC